MGGDYINESPHKVHRTMCVRVFEIVSLPIFMFLNRFVPFFLKHQRIFFCSKSQFVK